MMTARCIRQGISGVTISWEIINTSNGLCRKFSHIFCIFENISSCLVSWKSTNKFFFFAWPLIDLSMKCHLETSTYMIIFPPSWASSPAIAQRSSSRASSTINAWSGAVEAFLHNRLGLSRIALEPTVTVWKLWTAQLWVWRHWRRYLCVCQWRQTQC